MLVHRLLDAFFRTLDAVDAVRDRMDRVLGREPRPDPWAVQWPPPATPGEGEPKPNGEHRLDDSKEARPQAKVGRAASEQRARVADVDVADRAPSKQGPAKQAPSKQPTAGKAPAAKSKKATASAAAKAKPAAKKASSKGRKGSVDRSGKDFDSPRARAVLESLKEGGPGVVTEDAEYNGKKVLARVLWALGAAEQAGSERGLTTADTSALLHLAAGMEVFATNIGRACRDHGELIVESEADGRSKRYMLTAAGRAAAASIATRPLS